MSEVSDTLNAFFKSIEYSKGTQLNVSKIEQDLYDLLKSHAVIDKDSATFLEQSYQEDSQVFGSEGADIEGWDNIISEIERLSTTHKGK